MKNDLTKMNSAYNQLNYITNNNINTSEKLAVKDTPTTFFCAWNPNIGHAIDLSNSNRVVISIIPKFSYHKSRVGYYL